MQEEDLSEEQIEILSIAIGFESANDYIELIKHQNNLLLELDEDYAILSFNESELFHVVSETIIENNTEFYSSDPCNCNSRYNNCMTGALTNAAILHIGCGVLDLTIIAGIACHTIVTIDHITNERECSFQKDDCKRNCTL